MTERMKVTKRQHYVFRKYLKSWANTDTVSVKVVGTPG